ncbi:MAG: DUF2306 domain-containing protein [Acidobacteriaceae bacterium]
MASTSTRPAPNLTPNTTPTRWTSKHTLWLLMGLIGISVLFSTELPILHDRTGFNHDYLLKLLHDRRLLIPHALAGITAMFIGPTQFSSRLRRRHLQLHRILGRIYVAAIFIAAPLAIAISWGSDLIVGTAFQAGSWIFCTLMAFLLIRNRHIAQHRQWMIRSYAVTFTFIALRALDFIPAYNQMSDHTAVLNILCVTAVSAYILPDIAFHWHDLTHRRA